MRLGIDFGTTRTVVAAVEGGRYPVASFQTDEGFCPWIPTMAAFDGERWVYGEDAASRLRRADGRGVRSLKRVLGRLGAKEPLVAVPGPPVTGLELASGFLKHLRHNLLERSNLDLEPGEPLEAMVAVPANANSRQRFLTLEAFRQAGFSVLGMVNEPSAAAIEFAQRDQRVLSRRSPKRYVVVYDLGGGTFDTSAVSLEGRHFELLASEGIAHLGGDDFDEAILAFWEESAGFSAATDSRAAVLECCRRAKEGLTSHSRRLLLDPGEDLDVPAAVLDVSELFSRCDSLVTATLARLEDVFQALPETLDPDDPRQLGAVYLVGGAVAFPAVLRALRKRYKGKIQLAPEPHASTAVGLAVAADADAAVRLREATTRYFGVWREAEGGEDKVFDPLLQKDRMPTVDEALVVERRYHPAHTIGHLRFLECSRLDERGRPTGDLSPFGELYFPYDPALASRGDLDRVPVERKPVLADELILERYVYGADGTIAVHIENRSRGYRRELVLGSV